MKSRARARRAAATRWLYRTEDTLFRHNREANRERSIGELRRIARRVWRTVGTSRQLPTIRAGDGCRFGGRWTSYCTGFTEIVLARHHRNVLVLLHELTHALGPCTHGARFLTVYFDLLQRYAGYNRAFLQGLAIGRGVNL